MRDQVTEDGLDFRGVDSEIERNLILQSLELTRGNQARAPPAVRPTPHG